MKIVSEIMAGRKQKNSGSVSYCAHSKLSSYHLAARRMKISLIMARGTLKRGGIGEGNIMAATQRAK